MRKSLSMSIGAALVSAGLLVGCEKPADAPATSSTPSTPAYSAPADMPATVPAPESAAAPVVTETPAAATQVAGASEAEAKSLLQKVMEYIKANKLDDAEAGLTKLEGMKGSLPASLQGQIANARTALNTAKKGNDLKNIGGNLLGK
jgi:hypothetical protein